jgi:integrase/recombinase XerD
MARKQLTLSRSSNKTLREGFKDFIIHSRVKNLSEHTLTYYEDCFSKLCKFIDKDTPINEIDKATVDEFILFLRDSDISSITINTQLNGVRVILYYFMELGYMDKFSISKVKQEKPIKETYTESEIKLLLVKPNLKKCQFTDYRDWVIINLLLGTGMRIRTLLNLKAEDIDIENQVIKYKITKNRKQQIVPISRTLINVLSEYIQVRLQNGTEEDWLFCSRYGEKLTSNALQHSLRKYNQRRGVMKVGCHLWRHTFAKMWILGGGDVLRLQKILGHSTMDMVKEYVNLFDNELQIDFNNFNPLEKFNVNNTRIKMRI